MINVKFSSAVCSLLLLLLGVTGFAQNLDPHPHSELLSFKPTSPSVAAFEKFGATPVSYATGIPHISIPIYAYKGISNGLEFNISLDYHAGGIRVEEKASNVGLGWALSLGGKITRDMVGEPDDNGYLSQYHTLPSPVEVLIHTEDPNDPYYQYFHGWADSEPDIFNFSFNGRSGKFVIGKDGQVYMFPQQALKIEYSLAPGVGQGLNSFTITDDDGTKYIFDAVEIFFRHFADPYRPGPNPQLVGNAWHLSKIISPVSSQTIDLVYEEDNISYKATEPLTIYKALPGTGASDRLGTHAPVNNSYQIKRVKNIYFPNNVSVNFVYDTQDRCDVSGDHALKRIDIKDSNNIRSFKLDQNYSLSPNSSFDPITCPPDNSERRLILHRVTEFSGTNAKQPYIIEYNSMTMPSSTSYAQDHWGFFNGAVDNPSLVPYWDLGGYPIAPKNIINRANREPNPTYVQAGLINKIIYPTGGSSTFTFEPNEVAVTEFDPTFIYEKKMASVNGIHAPVRSTTFTVKKDNGHASSFVPFEFEFEGASPDNAQCAMKVYIKSADGTVNLHYVDLGPGMRKKELLLDLDEGTYQLAYEYTNGSCVDELFVVSLTWYDITKLPLGSNRVVGGVRIKKIEENDGINAAPINVREYKYNDEGGSSSSGRLFRRPQYVYDYSEACVTTSCPMGACEGKQGSFKVITSSSVFSLATFNGNSVVYGRVEEIFTGPTNSTIGKIVRKYDNTLTVNVGSLPMFDLSFPYVSHQLPEWLYGMPTSEEVFNSADVLKKQTSYFYNKIGIPLDGNQNVKGIKTMATDKSWILRWDYEIQRCMEAKAYTFKMKEYYPMTGRTELKTTITTEYKDNGAITDTVKYFYDPVYFNLLKTVTTDSKKKTWEQRTYYAYHYNTSGVLQDMKTRNMVTPVVSTETWFKETPASSLKLVSGEISEYQKTAQNFIKPYKISFFKSDKPVAESSLQAFNPAVLNPNASWYEERLVFEKFDAKGNLLQQYKTNDSKSNYIWDYALSLPVAEVQNADSASIAYTSFESDGVGNWQFTPSSGDASDAITGRKCYNMSTGTISKTLNSATTYVISFWAKTGASVSINGQAVTLSGTAINGWYHVQQEITGQVSVTIAGSGKIDELRLYPKGAFMTTFTYDPLVGLTSSADPNNLISYYEYDELGRLKFVRDSQKNILKAYEYNYQIKQ